ncbi:MAG: hypothetical protein R2706_18025 [Acidimicrobiales bacterium]
MTRVQNAEKGAVASEYAILLALIAVAMVTAVGLLSGAITGAIDGARTAIN